MSSFVVRFNKVVIIMFKDFEIKFLNVNYKFGEVYNFVNDVIINL